MRKLFVLLICIGLIFTSCKKEEEAPVSSSESSVISSMDVSSSVSEEPEISKEDVPENEPEPSREKHENIILELSAEESGEIVIELINGTSLKIKEVYEVIKDKVQKENLLKDGYHISPSEKVIYRPSIQKDLKKISLKIVFEDDSEGTVYDIKLENIVKGIISKVKKGIVLTYTNSEGKEVVTEAQKKFSGNSSKKKKSGGSSNNDDGCVTDDEDNFW